MISVCIATYNGEEYIHEQLNSILLQLNEDDEIIISDDHSKDKTLEIISNYNDSRIKIFINHQQNKGYSKNFENAITKATGDIIFICDQDDLWMDNKLELMIQALKYSVFVIHDAEVVDGKLNTLHPSHFDLHNIKTGFIRNFIKTRYIGACMAFKRELLHQALPFPDNQKLCAYDYWLTAIAEYFYGVNLIRIPLIKYRRHGKNASTGGTHSTNSLLKILQTRIYTGFKLIDRILKK